MKFVSATLKSIESLEKVKTKNSHLNKITPESKLITLFIVLVLMIFLKSLVSLILLLLFLCLEAFIFERSVFSLWLFVPLFTGIIAIPAIFIIPGEPLFHISFLTATMEGLKAAIYLTLRTLTAVTAVALLTKTTKWENVISSLRLICIPDILILILFLAYRYIFFFARIIEKTLLSLKSRVLGKEKTVEAWKLYAPIIGNLFIKTYDMQEKVYLSMISRGFEPKNWKCNSKWKISWNYIGVFLILTTILIYINEVS